MQTITILLVSQAPPFRLIDAFIYFQHIFEQKTPLFIHLALYWITQHIAAASLTTAANRRTSMGLQKPATIYHALELVFFVCVKCAAFVS